MARAVSLLIGLVLIASSCASDGGTGDGDLAQALAGEPKDSAEVSGAPEPAAAPEPTGAPEPAAAPEPTAKPEPTAAPEPQQRFDAVDAAIEAFIEREGLEGAGLIVVERDAGVVHHEAYGGFELDRISMVASASKMISAGVLMHLQDLGLLDVDAPVGDIVDWNLDHPEMVPAQLMSNSSGLVGLGPDLFYAPYLCQWLAGQTLQGCAEFVAETAGDRNDVLPPDTQFRYGGAQWQVAGALAEIASGKSWAELIDEIYVEPCDVDSLGYLSLGQVLDGAEGYPTAFGGDPSLHEPSANPSIEGGAHISTGDYGTLLLMHLRGGQCEGGPVLSQVALDAMHADRLVGYGGSAGPDTGYGMGWWIDRATGIISDGGAWGAYPWLNLEAGYGAYFVIEDRAATTARFSDELIGLVHLVLTGEELS